MSTKTTAGQCFYIFRGSSGFFNGFVSRHPGTEKTGHLEATWNHRHAMLVPADAANKTSEDLRSLGHMDWVTREVEF